MRPVPIAATLLTLALAGLTLGGCVSSGDPRAATATAAAVPTSALTPDGIDDPAWQADVRLSYKQIAGLDLPMAVFLPPGRSSLAERRPAVLCLHGGGWSGWQGGDVATWDGGVFAPHARYLSRRGAVAVTISYRNVPRPPKNGAAAPVPGAGQAASPTLFDLYADCRSAVRYLRQHADQFGIDPARIAVVGDSAGGHLAGCLATIDGFDTPGEDLAVNARADLAILCNPITDLTDPRWLPFVPDTVQPWEGDHPLSRVDRAKAISPAWHVDGRSAPAITLHGLADGTVDPVHSTDFQHRMQQAGRPCDLFTLPKAGHAFVLLGYKATGAEFLATLARIDRFLVDAGYLGAPTGSPWATPGTPTGCVVNQTIPPGGLALKHLTNLGSATTVSLRLFPEKLGGTLVQRSAGSGSTTGFTLALNNKGIVSLKAAGITLTGGTVAVGRWTQVVAVISTDRAALIVDGVTVAEQPLVDGTLIGTQLTVGQPFAGLIVNVRIYDSALGQDALGALTAKD